MSDTIKKFPYGWFRAPRGRKNALINNARKRSVPPNAWDDINYSKDCYLPYIIARRLYEKGLSQEEIIKKIRKKFKLSHAEAILVLPWKMRYEF